MSTKCEKFIVNTNGFDDLIDITSRVENIVSFLNVKEGIVNVCLIGSCASIITFEDEPNIKFDISKVLETIIPINKVYQHDISWHDGNAHAHLKAIFLGNSKTFSVIDGKIQLSEFQKIALIDFDNKNSTRQVIVSVVY